jgi:hypothetical protein
MAYDSESDRVILLGASEGEHDEPTASTWAYDFNTNTWVDMKSSPGPSVAVCAMSYDSRNDRIVLFGFEEIDGRYYPETWAYDFNRNLWQNMSPHISPPPSCPVAMAYDSESGRIIMFGAGVSAFRVWEGYYGYETWAYDYTNNTWVNLTTDIHPPLRYFHSMAYDSESDRIILFGGYYESPHGDPPFEPYYSICYDDTWVYDFNHNRWENVTAEQKIRPPPLAFPEMVYDSRNDRIILFGGISEYSNYRPGILFNYTWAYDFNANTWMNITPAISPPVPMWLGFAMAYDSESDQIILFKGLADDKSWVDTWALEVGMLPPIVVDTIPDNGETDVSLKTNVVIIFSSVMNRSATEDAVSIKSGFITGKGQDSIIAGKVWNARSTILTLSVLLDENIEYTVIISTVAKDIQGTPMERNYTFTFKTGYKDWNSWVIHLIIVVLIAVSFTLFIILGKRRRKGRQKREKRYLSQKVNRKVPNVGKHVSIHSPNS